MPLDEKPSSGQQSQAESNADEFARLFGALEQTAPHAETQPFAPKPATAAGSAAPREEAPPPGEFTQIFRQIAKPTSQAPNLDETASLPAAGGAGEFTQFFNSRDAVAAPAPPVAPRAAPLPSPVQQVSPAPVPPSVSRTTEPESFTQIFGPPPADPGRAAPFSSPVRPVESPGRVASPLPFAETTAPQSARREAFAVPEQPRMATPAFPPASTVDTSTSALTQIFPAEPEPAWPPAVPDRAPAPMRPAPANPAASGPGEFTRLMQGLNADAAPNAAPHADSAVQAGPPVSATGPGEFTRLMQGLNADAAPNPGAFSRPAVPAAPTASPAGPGEFTRLMQGLEGAPSGVSPMSAVPLEQPVARPPQAGGLHGGPGEFTRLMQSLGSQSSSQPAASAGVPSAPLDVASPFGGESEYTRVMRGSSLRQASSAGAAVPVAAAPAAVPAAEAPKDKALDGAGSKSKRWILLLLLANLLLLVVLIVLAALFLKHRH